MSGTITDLSKQTLAPVHKPHGFNLFCQLFSLLCHIDGRRCSMGLNTTLSSARPIKENQTLSAFFSLGVQSSIRWQIGKGANQSGLQRDKDGGGGPQRATVKKNDLPNEKEDILKGTEDQKDREKKHIEPIEKYSPLTIWLRGWQQPSSVFLELYNTPNYPVRKIKESQKAVEWKEESKFVPLGWEWQRKSDTHCICKVCQHVWIKSRLSQTDTPWHLSKSFIKT